MSSLTADQLDDLQNFLKDWLRHTGRSQSDLRRALQASSIRMPVLLEALWPPSQLECPRGNGLLLARTLGA